MLSAVLMLFIRTKSKHALSSLPCPPHLILQGQAGTSPPTLANTSLRSDWPRLFSENYLMYNNLLVSADAGVVRR